MKIHYLDPALRARPGHHFQWATSIVSALRSAGHEVRAYVNAEADAPTLDALARLAPAVPLFPGNPYAVPDDVDPLCGELALYTADALRLPAVLRQLPAADLWLWPTLFPTHLVAIALAGLPVPVAACIHWTADRWPQTGAAAWRYGARLALQARVQMRIGVTVEELVPVCRPLFDSTLEVLPLLVDAGPRAALPALPRTVGFFGDQRAGKGQRLLPALARELLAQGWQVVVHDSGGQLQHSLPPQAGLALLGYVDDLAAEMARCDLVVAPYDPQAYRAMGSGVVWEAVSRGVPVVVPAGTAPGRWVEQLGAGLTFTDFSAGGVLAAISAARTRYAPLAAAAQAAAAGWQRQHGVARFLHALLGEKAPAREPGPATL